MLWHNKSLILFPGDMKTEKDRKGGAGQKGEMSDCWQTFNMRKTYPIGEKLASPEDYSFTII
jgi:hypothetical protein